MGRTVISVAFLAVPVIASIISTFHLYIFFGLGDPHWMSAGLAIAFEAGSIGSFVALSVLDKLRKNMIYFIFSILFVMQIAGNIYGVFDFVNTQLVTHPTWLASFAELLTPLFGKMDPATYKFILAVLIGVPIPLVSLSFLKSLVDYLKIDSGESDTQEQTTEPVKKVKKVEKKAEIEQPIIQEEAVRRKSLWDEEWPEMKIRPAGPDDTHLAANPFE